MDDSHWEGKKCEAFYARGEVSLLQQNNSRGVFLNYFDTKWYLFIRKILDVLFFVFVLFAHHVVKWFSISFFVAKRSWVRRNFCHCMSHYGPFGTVLIHT